MGRFNLSENHVPEPGELLETGIKFTVYNLFFDVYKGERKVGQAVLVEMKGNYAARFKENPDMSEENNLQYNARIIIGSQKVTEKQTYDKKTAIRMTEKKYSFFSLVKDGKTIAYGEPVVSGKRILFKVMEKA